MEKQHNITIRPRRNQVLIEMAASMPITTLMSHYDDHQDTEKHIESKVHWTNFKVLAISSDLTKNKDLGFEVGDEVILPDSAVFTKLEKHMPHPQHPNIAYREYYLPLQANDAKVMKEAKEKFRKVTTEGTMIKIAVYALVDEYSIYAKIDKDGETK